MKSKTLENAVKVIPDFLKNAVDYLKSSFEESGKE